MAVTSNNEKPCTVQAGQGFSVLYKGRYFYSKYAPDKAILQTVNALHILPGSLVLCFSPCLLYGIPDLLNKLPEDCFIIGCELNQDLYELADKQLHNQQNLVSDNRFLLLSPAETLHLAELLEESSQTQTCSLPIPPFYTFKRVLSISCSAGVTFDSNRYTVLFETIQNCISHYWKNRLTIIQFGRLYAHNLFRNLSKLPFGLSFNKLIHSIAKPILVLGAGESCEKTVMQLRALYNNNANSLHNDFFIIAADAATPALQKHGFYPDAIAAMEGQLAIEKAYIGYNGKNTIIFADMLSRTHVLDISSCTPCFFTSEYAHINFLSHLQQKHLLPTLIPPLGSIGLTAVQLALLLRKAPTIPVLISGLDFSYTVGLTHMRGAPAHTSQLLTTTKLSAIPNYRAAFGLGTFITQRTDGSTVISTKALEGYAVQFARYFTQTPALYTLESGLPLGIPQIDLTKAIVQNNESSSPLTSDIQNAPDTKLKEAVISFLIDEQNALLAIKELLMHGQNLSSTDFNAAILDLLQNREYLYLHFPDGYTINTDISFLKRIRSQIDFFLTDIHFSLSKLQSK
ncbi:MAG: DUF115 domain-containing protein [Treponema sp.]|nr:DUF115 domain-containing protein [Treponema sp.]